MKRDTFRPSNTLKKHSLFNNSLEMILSKDTALVQVNTAPLPYRNASAQKCVGLFGNARSIKSNRHQLWRNDLFMLQVTEKSCQRPTSGAIKSQGQFLCLLENKKNSLKGHRSQMLLLMTKNFTAKEDPPFQGLAYFCLKCLSLYCV